MFKMASKVLKNSMGGIRKKKVSKNKKKSWRKHSDIADVEDYLESERLQERTGGIVALKSNDELFSLDKIVAEPSSTKKQDKKGKTKPGSKKSIKPLKCHSLLVSDAGGPKITSKISKTIESKRNRLNRPRAVLDRQTRRTEKLQAASKLQLVDESRATNTYDLWSDEAPAKVKARVKPPKHHGGKPSDLPSVMLPHAGASYNPSFEDHQDLLRTANSIEVAKLEREAKVQRQYEKHFPSKMPSAQVWLDEMSAGFQGRPDSELAADDLGESEGGPLVLPVNRENKKSKKQRRKEKEQKQIMIKARKEKEARIRKNEMVNLKTIKKDLAKMEKIRVEKAKLKEAARKSKRKRLGRQRFEEMEVELNLTEELCGSLRQLKPDGNLLLDRYKSLQRRNIIEPPSKPVPVSRKLKNKHAVKRTHRLQD